MGVRLSASMSEIVSVLVYLVNRKKLGLMKKSINETNLGNSIDNILITILR